MYRLHKNENPWGPAPKVIETIQQHLSNLGSYGRNDDEPLRSMVAEQYKLSAAHILFSDGARAITKMAAQSCLQPNTEVIVCPPTMFWYRQISEIERATVVEVPLETPNYTYNIDKILAAISSKTRIIYVCNPNNPTGTIMTTAELDTLLTNMPNNVLLVYDEVYHHYAITDPDFPAAIDYIQNDANMVILHNLCKAQGLASLCVGYGIAKPSLIERLNQIKYPRRISELEHHAILAVLSEDDYLQEIIARTIQEREWLFGQLQDMGLHPQPSRANFIMFKSPIPCQQLLDSLQAHGVLIRQAFGTTNHVRVSVGTEKANRYFISALKKILV
jgi:histidinol-phosphate aminotransferase